MMSLWDRTRQLLAHAGGDEEIRWRRRANAHQVSTLIASLAATETDQRVAIWLRVRLGGQRQSEVDQAYGYRDASGVHRLVQRLEAAATEDQALGRRLQQLTDKVSNVKR